MSSQTLNSLWHSSMSIQTAGYSHSTMHAEWWTWRQKRSLVGAHLKRLQPVRHLTSASYCALCFWDIVCCACHANKQPDSQKGQEIRGRFVSFAWDVGHKLTFLVLADDSQKVVKRSVLRLANCPENEMRLDENNLRLDKAAGKELWCLPDPNEVPAIVVSWVIAKITTHSQNVVSTDQKGNMEMKQKPHKKNGRVSVFIFEMLHLNLNLFALGGHNRSNDQHEMLKQIDAAGAHQVKLKFKVVFVESMSQRGLWRQSGACGLHGTKKCGMSLEYFKDLGAPGGFMDDDRRRTWWTEFWMLCMQSSCEFCVCSCWHAKWEMTLQSN